MWLLGRARSRRDDRGVTSVEYGIIAAFVGLAAIGGFVAIRNASSSSYESSIVRDPGVGGIAGDGFNDLPAAPIANTVPVGPQAQTIAFTAPTTGVINTSATLTATASSGLTVTYTSATPSICTVSGSTVTYGSSTGSCVINANQAGDADWLAAPQVQATISVQTQLSQTISFTAPASGNVGVTATLSATATSGLAVTFTSATGTICTVSGTTVTYLQAGTCSINANQAGDASWLAAPQVSGSVAVGKGSQTISFTAPASGTVGETPSPTLSATATSGLAVTFTSATGTICTVSGTTLTYLKAGTCTINANQAGNADWNAAPQVSGSVTVTTTVPGPCLNLSGSKTGLTNGSKKVKLWWDAPTTDGGDAIDYYQIQYRVAAQGNNPAGAWTDLQTTTSAPTSGSPLTTVALPVTNEKYDFRVAAHNSNGLSWASAPTVQVTSA